MGIRPARCYRWDSPAYTRIANNTADSFITGIPGTKITHYEMGNLKAEFDTEVTIVSKRDIQIRHNALEAARVAANKVLESKVGANNYRMTVRVYPHHVLRENVMATGAGADRVQSGMRNSFGKPVGTAARVHSGQAVFSVYVNSSNPATVETAKKALIISKSKLPGEMRIVINSTKKQATQQAS